MLRILCSTAAGVLALGSLHEPAVATASADITTLMAETRGAPPTLCLLAAGAIGNGGGGGGRASPPPPPLPFTPRPSAPSAPVELPGRRVSKKKKKRKTDTKGI